MLAFPERRCRGGTGFLDCPGTFTTFRCAEIIPPMSVLPVPGPLWPPGLPATLPPRPRHLLDALHVRVGAAPSRIAMVEGERRLDAAALWRDMEAVAGWLQGPGGVARGDRVLLMLPNGIDWAVGFLALLRIDAVVVPVNPMNRGEELRHLRDDSGARVAIAPAGAWDDLQPLLATGSEAAPDPASPALDRLLLLPGPDGAVPAHVRVTPWAEALAGAPAPAPWAGGGDDLCVMPYTSGTTGAPKGCRHSHATVGATVLGGLRWFGLHEDDVFLSVLPFFHVTGLVGSLLGPLLTGAKVVVQPRWQREAAADLIERHRVTVWQSISTMVIDFLGLPDLAQRDLRSLRLLRGGGAAMPEALAQRLFEVTGLRYVEGYGMSETIAATHINPPHAPTPQCLGIPVFEVDARLIDPGTLTELPADPQAVGEIVVHAPQVMQGYWNRPEADAEAFMTLDGKRFLRTGDLARVDAQGRFFMVDRLKRMINASGFKVWPAEVEALLFAHPAVAEACVIGVPDARRGESVKALVVLRAGWAGRVREQDVIDWARDHMAAYKRPHEVEFVSALPRSGTGKVRWRELQEAARATPA